MFLFAFCFSFWFNFSSFCFVFSSLVCCFLASFIILSQIDSAVWLSSVANVSKVCFTAVTLRYGCRAVVFTIDFKHCCMVGACKNDHWCQKVGVGFYSTGIKIHHSNYNIHREKPYNGKQIGMPKNFGIKHIKLWATTLFCIIPLQNKVKLCIILMLQFDLINNFIHLFTWHC